MTSHLPESPDGEDLPALADRLTREVQDNTVAVTRAARQLAGEKRWRRRFALGAAVSVLLGAVSIIVILVLIGQVHGTQGRLEAVVACNDNRSRQFVNAVAARAQISNQQNADLGTLLSQVLHLTNQKEFVKDVNAYIDAAARLRAQKLPVYPENACQ